MGDLFMGFFLGAFLTAFAIDSACENVMVDACFFGVPLSGDKERSDE